MDGIMERQQFTPEGQELPAWLSYQAVSIIKSSSLDLQVLIRVHVLIFQITTTIDGIAVTTGTILKLPLTCELGHFLIFWISADI